MIRQPRYREHYNRSADEVAAEAIRMIRHRGCRMAVFVYGDGESQVTDGFGSRFVRRCALFADELVGVYGVDATHQQIRDDIEAATYGHLLRAAPRRVTQATGMRCAVDR